MRKTITASVSDRRYAKLDGNGEDTIDRALARMLTSEDPAQRAIAARVILGDMYPSRREGRLH